MNYEEMTWLEINHKIAEILEPNAIRIRESRFNAFEGEHSVEVFVDDDIVEYDFSKPSDAWPIIVENGINLNRSSLQMNGYTWQAGKDFKTQSRDKNPLRAAMICFLKMKDAEK